MTDTELFRVALERMGWSLSTAGKILNVPKGTLAGYSTGRASIPPNLWRTLLEHQGALLERMTDIIQRASQGGAPVEPKGRKTARRLRREGTDTGQ
jgi:hypothetical protein